jgi:hypothetical protein
MGRSCSIYRDVKCIEKINLGASSKGEHLGDLDIIWRILNCIFKKAMRDGVSWIQLAHGGFSVGTF